MNYMNSLRSRAAIAIVSLLWINLGMMVLRYLWGMEADPVVVLGGGAAIAGVATLTWWRDRTGTGDPDIDRRWRMPASVALLVYGFTGSPLQIDMHMYFFASSRDLVRPGSNWRPIVAFTGVTAVHHLALYLVLPAAVFPGEATLSARAFCMR
jgi:methyl-accepting chemotaxis protein